MRDERIWKKSDGDFFVVVFFFSLISMSLKQKSCLLLTAIKGEGMPTGTASDVVYDLGQVFNLIRSLSDLTFSNPVHNLG